MLIGSYQQGGGLVTVLNDFMYFTTWIQSTWSSAMELVTPWG